jgi:hypothetical protein
MLRKMLGTICLFVGVFGLYIALTFIQANGSLTKSLLSGSLSLSGFLATVMIEAKGLASKTSLRKEGNRWQKNQHPQISRVHPGTSSLVTSNQP